MSSNASTLIIRGPAGVKTGLGWLMVLVYIGGCTKLADLRVEYYPQNPRDAYEHGLESSGLNRSVMGASWLNAAADALLQPVAPGVPYLERGFVDPARPQAAAFEVSLTRGQRFIAEAHFFRPDSGSIFLDLFEELNSVGLGKRRVASSDTTQMLQYDATRTGTYILRLQPELLAGGQYELAVRTTASIIFPVVGKDSEAIKSVFGDSRDGGRRSHHGVDIFAPRGTPAIAASDGVISSTRVGGLGGKTVWLRSSSTGANLYYAHLDEQLVDRGERVSAGDTLGLVGNTGNARTTSPHLHFGIYRNGPVDPFPFVHEPEQRPGRITVSEEVNGSWMRTRAEASGLYAGPSERSEQVYVFDRYTSVEILAAAANYYRVRVPDGMIGFIRGNRVESESNPIKDHVLASESPIMSIPAPRATTIDRKNRGDSLSVHSRFGDYLRVTTESGQIGWLLDI